MFDDLIAAWGELGNMLADVQENYGDMHAEDVAQILHNCGLKATELTQQIVARREDVQKLSPYWKVPHREADAGMPPAKPPTGQPPPVIQGGPDIS